MLRNPVYCGLTVFNRNSHTRKGYHGADRNIVRANPEEKWLVAPGLHDSIITKEQFDLAQSIRQGRVYPRMNIQDGTIKHQFAGIFRCSKCGRNLFTLNAAKGGPYIACYTPGCSAMVKERYMESHIIAALTAELNRLEAEEKHDHAADLSTVQQEIDILTAELQKLEVRKSRLYTFLEDGTYDRDTFKDRMSKAEEEQQAIAERLEKAKKKHGTITASNTEALRERLENALSLWPSASPQARNSLLKSVIADAVYTKEKKSKPTDFSVALTLQAF